MVAGDARTVTAGVRRYADAGATDLLVSPLGDVAERARTLEVLGRIARGG